MKLPEKTARDIIDHLGFQLAKSWQAFLVAKNVHEARNVGRINCSHYFFSVAEDSCLETAIIVLAKVVVPHKKSITIQYLQNYSEQNPEIYHNVDMKVIRESVSRQVV